MLIGNVFDGSIFVRDSMWTTHAVSYKLYDKRGNFAVHTPMKPMLSLIGYNNYTLTQSNRHDLSFCGWKVLVGFVLCLV